MSVFQHSHLCHLRSRLADEFTATWWLISPQLAPVGEQIVESGRCVGQFGAHHRDRTHHSSRQFDRRTQEEQDREPTRRHEIIAVRMQPPNTSLEPTAYAVSVQIMMDSLFTFAVSSPRLPRLWLSLIR